MRMKLLILTTLIFTVFLFGCVSVQMSPESNSTDLPSSSVASDMPESTDYKENQPSPTLSESEPFDAEMVSTPQPTNEHSEFAGELEPPLLENDKRVPVPVFLTQEQQLLYLRAYKMSIVNIGTYVIDSQDFFPVPHLLQKTETDTILLDGAEYYPALNRYQSWDLFYNTLRNIFTEEYLDKSYFNSYTDDSKYITYFRPVDGRVYYLPTERGYDPMYNQDTTAMDFKLLEETPEYIEIQVTATYDIGENVAETIREAYNAGLISNTITYEIVLVLEEDGWRFSQFDVPF